MHFQVLSGDVQVPRTRTSEICRGREAQSTCGGVPPRVVGTVTMGSISHTYGQVSLYIYRAQSIVNCVS